MCLPATTGPSAVTRTDTPPPARGRLSLFGHESTQAEVALQPRSVGWRTTRAAQRVGIGLVAAPLLALVPPHVPWAAGAVLAGLVLGGRRWRERYTVTAATGPCPRCGTALTLHAPRPLKDPLTMDCPACHHQASLRVDLP